MGYMLVFLGAGLGGILRQGANLAAARIAYGSLTASTLTVNIMGSLLMGLVVGYASARTGFPPYLRLFLTTGVLGGFTTFSAFSLELATLLERGRPVAALIYAIASVILSSVAIFAGLALARARLG